MTGTLSPGWMMDVANAAAAAGASFLVQSTLIIAAGLALAYALRGRGAAAQSAVLRAFLAAVFLCTPVSFLLRHMGVSGVTFEIPLAPVSPEKHGDVSPARSTAAPLPERFPAPRGAAPAPAADPGTRNPSPAPAATVRAMRAPQAQPAQPAPSATVRPGSRDPFRRAAQTALAPLFTLLWAACAVFLLGRLCLNHVYILILRHSAVRAKPSALAACRDAAQTLGVHPVPVLQSPSVRSPFLAGTLRPCIFLPLGGAETVLEERSVFLHELAHLARRDTSWNLARQVGVALFPFQPLLWVLSSRIEETSDFACDDYVTHATGMHRAYANSLIAIARHSHPALHEASAGVGIISFKSPMRRRVERILDLSRAVTLRVGTRMLVLVSSFCLCITFLSGLIGFRGKSFAQTRKIPETLSRGGRAAVFALLPLIGQQVSASRQSPGKPDDSGEAAPQPEGPLPETAVPPNENAPAPDAVAAVSPEAPAESASPAPSNEERIPDRTVAAIPDPSPDRTDPAAELTNVERTAAMRPAPAPFRTAASSGPVGLPIIYSTSEAYVKTGQVSIKAKEQETYSGLKSNLDWGKQSPVWSPDGKSIAFTEYTGFGVWISPAAGGEPRLLYNNRNEWQYLDRRFGGGNMRTLCFTPDGGSVTVVNYIFDRERGSRAEIQGSEVVYYGIVPVIENVEVATGKRRILFIGAADACWSPDGKTLIAATDSEDGESPGRIVALDPVSAETRLLAESGFSPAVTPDGRTVVYTDGRSLLRVPIEGGKSETLPVEGYLRNLRCSPDGVWVLGTGNRDGGSAHTWLRAYSLKTGKTRDILYHGSQSMEMGAWSPNGKQFCYTLSNPEGKTGSTIWIADFHPEASVSPASADDRAPAPFRLIGNYPNPFNPSTTIEFSLPAAGKAGLAVYNMAGQKVRELVEEHLSAGKHAVVWNGRDSAGKPVSSGVYIARLKMEGKVESHRMTLVK